MSGIELNLAPGLLLSMPQLDDPNFARAVVLMIEHNDEGSFGLILNRPSDLTVGKLLSSLDIEWNGDESDQVWSGGPVMPSSGWVLHQPSALAGPATRDLRTGLEEGETIEITPELSLSTSPETLRAIAQAPPPHFRFLLGYSGWGPGQLAEEMARGSWLHADLDADIIFDTPADDMWETTLRAMGVDPEAIVQGRGVH